MRKAWQTTAGAKPDWDGIVHEEMFPAWTV